MKTTSMKRGAGMAGPYLLLAGCAAVGPRYRTPDLEVAWEFHAAHEAAPGDAVRADWWTALGDPQLTRYVREAVEGSHELGVARARVREARAKRRAASSRSLPHAGAGASYRAFESSDNGVLGSPGARGVRDELFDLSFDAAWELDVFGAARREAEAAGAHLDAAVEARREVLLSIVSEVARNYVELRGAQRRLELAVRNVRLQADTLELVTDRHQSGLAPELDVQRARTQLQVTRSRQSELRAEIHAAGLRIAVLTGRRPTELLEELVAQRPVPVPPEIVPVGLPSELLRRRPDVRRAERELHAATAELGVATAELYPRFFLTGLAGLESLSFTDAFDAASRTWSLGPQIRWPLFQGGRLRAGIAAAEARLTAAHERFKQAVLVAVEDVERSLVAYAEQQLERRDLEQAVQASARTVDLASSLYDEGLTDFLTVIDAERTHREVEDRLAASETAVALEVVHLYKTLGGGWEPFEPEEARKP